LKFNEVRFLSSYAGNGKPPMWNLPEIAVVGRSNVGKSSFINAVTGRKSVARISSKPGKTRLVNYFAVDASFILVDLPGYGYAKASKQDRNEWKKIIETYLKGTSWLKNLLILVDAKVGLTDLDRTMIGYCEKSGIPYFIIANKVDKLNQSGKAARKKEFDTLFGAESYMFFSALEKKGVEEFTDLLSAFLGYGQEV